MITEVTQSYTSDKKGAREKAEQVTLGVRPLHYRPMMDPLGFEPRFSFLQKEVTHILHFVQIKEQEKNRRR